MNDTLASLLNSPSFWNTLGLTNTNTQMSTTTTGVPGIQPFVGVTGIGGGFTPATTSAANTLPANLIPASTAAAFIPVSTAAAFIPMSTSAASIPASTSAAFIPASTSATFVPASTASTAFIPASVPANRPPQADPNAAILQSLMEQNSNLSKMLMDQNRQHQQSQNQLQQDLMNQQRQFQLQQTEFRRQIHLEMQTQHDQNRVWQRQQLEQRKNWQDNNSRQRKKRGQNAVVEEVDENDEGDDNAPGFRTLADLPRDSEIMDIDPDVSEQEFRSIFPFLAAAHGDESSLISEYSIFTVAEVARENNTERKKSVQKSVALDKALARNMPVVTKGFHWEKVFDNKVDHLHPMRFDRFALTPSQELFRRAAVYFETKKITVIPIKGYDLSHLCIPNTITDKGWEEAHNPKSLACCLKLYSKENYQRQNNSKTWTVVQGDDGEQLPQSTFTWVEIESMEKFHHSFFCFKIVRFRALPWDRSIEVVEIYLIEQSWFFRNPLQNGFHRYISQGAFCAGFVDSCILENAVRFDNKREHLGARDMDSQLLAYCRGLGHTKCKSTAAASYSGGQQGSSGSGSSGSKRSGDKQSEPPAKKKKPEPRDWHIDEWSLKSAGSQYIGIPFICRPWNMNNQCPNATFDEKTHRCTDKDGNQKLHVCNKKMPSKFPCGQLHPFCKH